VFFGGMALVMSVVVFFAGPVTTLSVACAFIVPLGVYDFSVAGRLHGVTLWGGTAIVVSLPIRLWLRQVPGGDLQGLDASDPGLAQSDW
jgi:hypothetical protein